LLADVSRLRSNASEVRNSAVPFPGVWHSRPASRDLERIVSEFGARGMTQAAAEIDRQRADRRKSSQAQVLYEFGITKAKQDKLDEAIVNFRQAVELDPQFFDALSALATALHETGKIAQAIPLYERALRIDARNVGVLYNLALAHFVSGERGKARQDAQLLEAIDSASAAELAAQFAKLQSR